MILPLTTVQCTFSASSTFPCTTPDHRLRSPVAAVVVAVVAAAVAFDAAPLDGRLVDLGLVDSAVASSFASGPVTSRVMRHCSVVMV